MNTRAKSHWPLPLSRSKEMAEVRADHRCIIGTRQDRDLLYITPPPTAPWPFHLPLKHVSTQSSSRPPQWASCLGVHPDSDYECRHAFSLGIQQSQFTSLTRSSPFPCAFLRVTSSPLLIDSY